MQYTLRKNESNLDGEIVLPASKSISNRVLIISALAYSPYDIKNLSDSDDTKLMHAALYSNTNRFDIGHAGTAMRFLTAFLSKIVGEWVITGSQRMKERPIRILVDALTRLGAKIEYEEKEGYPPLRIWGSALKGGVLELDGSVSSQYISALLMIAPTLQNGLTLRLKNKIISRSYIDLTLKLMKQFGVRSYWGGNEIRIEEQAYQAREFTVESDWSAASYWYQLAALAPTANLKLKGLRLPSLQGDATLAEWFTRFGIESKAEADGIRLIKKEEVTPTRLTLDFTENPDVAQTLAVLCVLKKIPFRFSGLETLRIKETDRIAALQIELSKLGARIEEPKAGELSWDGSLTEVNKDEEIIISTYKDHRMAMAFAPAAINYPGLKIDDPSVVTKSYPKYWEDLKLVGFVIE
ncbi:MAG: 3-phosphoshikimate 1-carboxyvinyltransferase [Bacteroidota bacterium]|nr:3-phosphoshikimate 1-carboxyvinyltransferase [Bacteroidota bacterium]MDP4206019.1 3-phosphoshikimate 1-carboxyvinyltransferase [Bacteroidota bacterium]